jgi:hypothetical protein
MTNDASANTAPVRKRRSGLASMDGAMANPIGKNLILASSPVLAASASSPPEVRTLKAPN